MIEVSYHRKYNGITVIGHAKTGEIGHDLVCAAVSGLVLTMAANVNGLVESGAVKDHTIRLEHGTAEVSCVPVRKMRGVVALVYETVCHGFEALSRLYPENIRYQVYE